MTPKSLIFQSERIDKQDDQRRYYDALLMDSNQIYHAHARFNFSNPYYPENTLYINILSTFRSYIRGYVELILWKKECKWYIGQPKEFATIHNCAEKMIHEIIKFSPEYIDYIIIPCAQERLDILREHYLQIGKTLQEKDIIWNIGYHKQNSVYFQLSK